jgi:hypothetical protein
VERSRLAAEQAGAQDLDRQLHQVSASFLCHVS